MTDHDSRQDGSPGAHDPRVDELRQRLRSLGYLDAGVDRFVLGPARSERAPLAIAALASLRIGVLAAVLLGPAAAVGIGTRLPGLITGPRDAVVVAAYLALLFGVAATIVSFAVSLLAVRLPVPAVARRPRLVSRVAGAVAGGACLVYLTLWWRIANADLVTLAPGWTAFVLAIAVAISLLLGHATTIAAFAVLVARHGQEPAITLQRRSAWRLTAVAAVAAFAGSAALLLIGTPAPASGVPAPRLAVVSPGIRVTLVGIDGFDPAVLESLASEGRVPNLARIFGRGAIRLEAEAASDPAREWTTIATGQPPEVHGVHSLETRRVAGLQGSVTSVEERGLASALRDATDLLRLTRPSTASGAELQSKTMWEVAADAGLRAAVVNWWATWPATAAGPNAPIVVSDRATLRLEHGGALDGELAPSSVYERLRGEWPAIRQEAAALVDASLPATLDAATTAAWRRAAEIDAVQLAMASRLGASLDLLAIYLPGLDIAQYALIGSGTAAAPSELAAKLEALRTYYAYLDLLLGAITTPKPGELVIVVAEPGRTATIAPALLAAAGAVADPGARGTGRAVDIAPTVLHALGVPVSRELAGRPLLALFADDLKHRFPVRDVETYGRRSAPSTIREGQPLDREMIERLKSLGYVR